MPTLVSAKARNQSPKIAPRKAPGFLRANWIPLLAAALLNVPAIARVQYVPALFSVACIAFVVLRAASWRQAFAAGIAYVAASGLLLDYWLVPVLTDYTGGNWLLAVGCYLVSWALLAPFFALQFALFALLRNRGVGRAALLRNAALFAALWVAFEWLRGWLFSAVPFMGYAWGTALSENTFLLQPAAFGGVYALTFLLVFPACFIAAAPLSKSWRTALVAPALLLLQFFGGWILFRRAEGAEAGREPFDVALVQPAVPAGFALERANINILVPQLLRLNQQAQALHPALTVWTETTVPWSYRADDDFINELVKATAPSGSCTLIGLNGAGEGNAVQNSLYLLGPKGAALGRYDKQELLPGAEKPFAAGFGLPFQGAERSFFSKGVSAPVPSPWGAAGLLLCNEATIPAQARARAEAGATWLAVVGNDAWFGGTYIPHDHFYQCRIRAVENRKDVLVNINLGASGVVRASGAIAARFNGNEAAAYSASVQPNEEAPPSHTAFILFILLLLGVSHRFFFITKPKNQSTHA